MDPNKDIAEERLLRVIEGGGSAGKPRKPLKRESFYQRWAQSFADLMENMTDRSGGGVLQLGLPFLNMVVWVVLAVLGIYLSIDFFVFQKRGGVYYLPNSPVVQRTIPSSDAAPGASASLKPLSEYIQPVSQRNPFTGSGVVEKKEEVIVEAPKEDFSKLTDGLSIVGINRGPNPEAFIEDTIQKRTYFVKAGDPVKNMTVKEIKDDGVVLLYKDKELTIG